MQLLQLMRTKVALRFTALNCPISVNHGNNSPLTLRTKLVQKISDRTQSEHWLQLMLWSTVCIYSFFLLLKSTISIKKRENIITGYVPDKVIHRLIKFLVNSIYIYDSKLIYYKNTLYT